MNIAKNMEAIFVAAIALSCVTAFATAATPAPAPRLTSVNVEVANGKIPTIVVTAKRLTAAQKAKLAS